MIRTVKYPFYQIKIPFSFYRYYRCIVLIVNRIVFLALHSLFLSAFNSLR